MGEFCYFPKTLFLFLFLLMFSGFLFASWGSPTAMTDYSSSDAVGYTSHSKLHSCYANGKIWVVFPYKKDASNRYIKLVNDDGNIYTLDDASASSECNPTILSNGTTLHIVYFNGGSNSLRYVTFNTSTNQWGTPETVLPLLSSNYAQGYHCLGFDNDGYIVIFFLGLTDDQFGWCSDGIIWLTRKLSGGGWSTKSQVSHDCYVDYLFHGTCSGTNFYIVYDANNSVYYRTGVIGGMYSSEETVDGLDGYTANKTPWLYKYSSDIHVVWITYNDDDNRYELKYRKKSGSWQDTEIVTTGDSWRAIYVPCIFVDSDGYRHISYTKKTYQDVYSNDRIYQAYYCRYEGTPTQEQMSDNESDNDFEASFAEVNVNSQGTRYVTWQQTHNQQPDDPSFLPPYNIYYRKYTPSMQKGVRKSDNKKSEPIVFYNKKTLFLKNLQGSISYKIALYNLSGKVVKKINVDRDSSISLKGFSPGIYLVKVSNKYITAVKSIAVID